MTRTRHPAKLAKRGDQVYLEMPLTDLSVPGGQTDPIDLSGASVRFIMEGPEGGLIVNSSAEVVDPTAGIVEYLFADGELPEVGDYRAEWRVLSGDGDGDYRWPPGRDSYLEVEIGEPIATDRDPAEIAPLEDIEVALIEAEEGVIGRLSVSDAPQNQTDVLRQAEYDDLDSAKADADEVNQALSEKADREGDDISPNSVDATDTETDTLTLGGVQIEVDPDDPEIVPGMVVVATADVFSTLQDAVNYAELNDIPEVFIPKGDYTLSTILRPYWGHIYGAGVGETVLTADSAVFGPNEPESNHGMVSEMTIEMTGGDNDAVAYAYGDSFTYRDMHIRGSVGQGIRGSVDSVNCSVENVEIQECTNQEIDFRGSNTVLSNSVVYGDVLLREATDARVTNNQIQHVGILSNSSNCIGVGNVVETWDIQDSSSHFGEPANILTGS